MRIGLGTGQRKSWSKTGTPKDGASETRTLRGMIVSYTASPRCARASSRTWAERLFRLSYMVSTMPCTWSAGLNAVRTRSTMLSTWLNPSRAKNSHCSGTSTESAATRALTVSMPSDGGQSIST